MIESPAMHNSSSDLSLDAAHHAYELGYIPVPVRGKAPFIENYQKYSTNELAHPTWETVRSWFNEYHTGFALLCGTKHIKDGQTYRLLALDVDLTDVEACIDIMRAIPASTAVKRGSKGFTAFYLVTEEQSNSTKMAGVYDWLAKKKVTVMPPSVHPDMEGAVYEWVDGATMFPIRSEKHAMPAPETLPVFTEDDFEILNDACEQFKPDIETQISAREWDGSENTELYTQAWINDRLITHFGWLPPLLEGAGIPWKEQAGKILTVNTAREKCKPNGQVKSPDERTMNWHFVPYGWNGLKGGIRDHGDVGGTGFTPLDVISWLLERKDTRGARVSDEVWAVGLQAVAPEAFATVTDKDLFNEMLDAAAERDRAAEQAEMDKNAAEINAERLQAAAPSPQLAAPAEAVDVSALPDDLGEPEDVEVEVKDLTTENMKPVPDWVAENAPGLIGELYLDIVGRYDSDTPKSVALNTALTLCAIPAALRVTMHTNGKKLTPSLYVLSLAYTGEGKDPARQYPAHFFAEASSKCMADSRMQIQQMPSFARFQAHFNGTLKGPNWEPDAPPIDPGAFGLTPDGKSLMPNAASSDTPFADDQVQTLKAALEMYEAAMLLQRQKLDEERREVKLMPVLGLLRSSNVPTGSPALLEECYKARGILFTWDEFGKHWGLAMSQPERDWDRSMIENFTRGPVASTAKVESKDRNIRKFDAHDIAPSMHGFCVPDQLITQIKQHNETVSDGALNRRLIFMDPVKPEKTREQRVANWVHGANKRPEPPKELIEGYLSLFTGFNDDTQLPTPGKIFEKDPDGNIVRNEDRSPKSTYHNPMEELIWVGHRVPKDYLITMGLGEGGFEYFEQSQVGKLIIEIETRYDKQRRAFIAQGNNYGANCVVRAAEYTWRVACIAAYASRRTAVEYSDVHWADQYVSVSVSNLLGMTGTMIVSERTQDENRILELIQEAFDMSYGLATKTKSAIRVYKNEGEERGAVRRGDLHNRFRSGRENGSTRFKIALANLLNGDAVQEDEVRTSETTRRPVKCIRADHLWDLSYARMMAGDG